MQSNNAKIKTDSKQRAYLHALEMIKFIDALDKKDLSVRIISQQLLRSTTSIGANIIEAQAGSTKRDFTNFFTHALKSANESKFWLGLLRDSNKADRAAVNLNFSLLFCVLRFILFAYNKTNDGFANF